MINDRPYGASAGRWLVIVFIAVVLPAFAQKKSNDVYVDKSGVMRWGDSDREVHGFGINYTAMFAHAYRTAKRLNISLEDAIDDDVYHFARLGFDLFRVHVWDTEISDTLGNLLQNEHLRLFDYALFRMKERGMKFVITPIAYWGNGWPERDEKTPGFSRKYGKNACLTNPEAIKAQERYLYQFLNHVNKFTGIAFKTEPAIIAFEVSNEPHHGEAPEQVTAFINRMVKSMRNTGCKKPIFYNVSHSIHLADAYFNSNIQGGTFQWYPTGLGAGYELRGNFLPNVDSYAIPFANHPKFKRMAKIVYEFDAADVGRSYIYPAMARSFREAGMQLAAHFAYDPTFMADVNTEYGTHYMNLAYAPQKALSLMIAGEVFRSVPMFKDYGKYPENQSFESFSVSYEKDLAQMNTETKFLYTNHTSTIPGAPAKLEMIAGFGNSSVVRYQGAGAYFLDRIKPGVWRLEVMPDAIWVGDPFEKTSPSKKVSAVQWRRWPISINLPDLGNFFSVDGMNGENSLTSKARNGSFVVFPGTYLLTKDGVNSNIHAEDKWKNIFVGEFVAPGPSVGKVRVQHAPVTSVPKGTAVPVKATISSTDSLASVQVYAWQPGARSEMFDMQKTGAFSYEATIPEHKVNPGVIRYHIVVKEKNVYHTFPSGLQTHPQDWDFYDRSPYEVVVLPALAPVLLFNASVDADKLLGRWLPDARLTPTWEPGKSQWEINVDKLLIPQPWPEARPIHDYSMRFFVGDRISGVQAAWPDRQKIILRGHSLHKKPCPIQIALVAKNGTAVGGVITVAPERGDYEFSLADLENVKLVTLPRPYPTFLPYYFEAADSALFNMAELEVLQLSIGPGIPEMDLQKPHGIAIESIRLE